MQARVNQVTLKSRKLQERTSQKFMEKRGNLKDHKEKGMGTFRLPQKGHDVELFSAEAKKLWLYSVDYFFLFCIQITYSLAIPNLNFFASIARKIATVLSLEKKEKVFNKVENFRLYFPGFAAPTLRKKNFFIWFRHP